MKRLLTIVILLISFSSFAQDYPYAKVLKEKSADAYNVLKEMAKEKWENDYSMMLYEIDKQSEALMLLLVKVNDMPEDFNIFLNAVTKWAPKGSNDYNGDVLNKVSMAFKREESGIRELSLLKTDWVMVKYEYEKQTLAKRQLD